MKKNKPRDLNKLATSIVAEATGEVKPETNLPEKNPHAVALGRLGGLRGGKARAQNLSAKKRKNIAKKAAFARWNKEKEKT
jgi:hypothetical protein